MGSSPGEKDFGLFVDEKLNMVQQWLMIAQTPPVRAVSQVWAAGQGRDSVPLFR